MITLDRIRELCEQFGYIPFDISSNEYHIGEVSVFKVCPNENSDRDVVYWDNIYTLGTRYSSKMLTEEKVIEMIKVNLKNIQAHEERQKQRLAKRMLDDIQKDF